jgi:hypothetical protein
MKMRSTSGEPPAVDSQLDPIEGEIRENEASRGHTSVRPSRDGSPSASQVHTADKSPVGEPALIAKLDSLNGTAQNSKQDSKEDSKQDSKLVSKTEFPESLEPDRVELPAPLELPVVQIEQRSEQQSNFEKT